MDIDPARVQVVAQSAAGKPTFYVTVPCDGARPCIGVGPSRENHLLLEFRSELMAERVAAALRHASSLCEGTP
jgi:hypothetical protein